MTRYAIALVLTAFSVAAAEMPVRQVILYKHGVGYFERSGTLAAGESARLDFKAAEMNDVLKSLTLGEKGGTGKIRGVRYDSSEPLEKKLSEFPFSLAAGQALSALLDQLKGARVDLTMGGNTVSGAVVGGRVIPAAGEQPQREQVTILLDSGELQTIDLSAVSAVRFSDPKLQAQFKEYLAAVVGARSRELRSVYIDSTDSGSRQISASYMVPTAVWKSSYRLIFDQGPQPTLEGWAIVDNTTGEDWTNIQLSLVSGRPISFISRLYEPRYVNRPVAELPDDAAANPVVHAGAVEFAMAPPPPPPRAEKPARQKVGASRDSLAMAEAVRVAPSSIGEQAEARELGELFEYRIPGNVTVRKSESAMLPFLQQPVQARKLLIYLESGSQHPTNAAELTNSSGKTLDGGPVTVFDGGAYGGEALMDTIKAGDKRLISYAVDLGTRITTLFDQKSDNVREIHFRRGILTTRHAAVESKTYTINNVDSKAKTLIIEHPARPNYTLIDQKPSEKTRDAYRFEVPLKPASEQKFTVTEERTYETSTMIVNLTPDVLVSYLQNKALTDAGRKQLEQIVSLKRRIAQIDADLQLAQTEISALERDQERIRQNINSLNRVASQQQQVQSYARQLDTQETRIAALRDRIAELNKQRAAAQAELDAAIEKMEF